MRWLGAPRTWFILAAMLGFTALFLVGGPAGGLIAFAACATFIVGAFRKLRGTSPEDRTAGTGMFGGGL